MERRIGCPANFGSNGVYVPAGCGARNREWYVLQHDVEAHGHVADKFGLLHRDFKTARIHVEIETVGAVSVFELITRFRGLPK